MEKGREELFSQIDNSVFVFKKLPGFPTLRRILQNIYQSLSAVSQSFMKWGELFFLESKANYHRFKTLSGCLVPFWFFRVLVISFSV